jgi:hypothetical protein
MLYGLLSLLLNEKRYKGFWFIIEMKRSDLIFIVLLIFTINFGSSVPLLEYNSPPTPLDGSSQTSRDLTINVSLTEENLEEYIFNWDGTNYTFYNNSLMVMLNFNSYNALTDFSGGNDGTAQGDASSTSSGKYNEGYFLDGNGDYISLTDNTIDTYEDFTVEIWMKPASVDRQAGVITKDTSGTDHEYTTEFQIETRSNNEVWFSMGSQTSWAWSSAHSSALLEPDVWYYVVATVSGTTQKLYINGVENASTTITEPRRIDNGLPVNIGMSEDTDGQSSPQYFNGTIDEVRIWNRSLSAEEIIMFYKSNLRKYDTDKWEYIMTQTNLNYDTYYYQAFATNTDDESASTSEWDVTISSGSTPTPSGGEAPFFPDDTQIIAIGLCLGIIGLIFRKEINSS